MSDFNYMGCLIVFLVGLSIIMWYPIVSKWIGDYKFRRYMRKTTDKILRRK